MDNVQNCDSYINIPSSLTFNLFIKPVQLEKYRN
jgi:hypothetical protein